MGFHSSPTIVRRPDGAGAVNCAVPDDQDPGLQAWPAAARVGPSEHQSCDRPRLGAARVHHHPTRLESGSCRRPAASLTSYSYGLTPAGDRPRSRYGSPRPHLVQEGIANVLVR